MRTDIEFARINPKRQMEYNNPIKRRLRSIFNEASF